jgi:RNA polymerase sigma-70 factor (ECF subfamily)
LQDSRNQSTRDMHPYRMATDQRQTARSTTPGNVRQTTIGDDPDAVLLRRMADGDESALSALYDRWVDRVHSVAFWILKDADEAEDVVEETFWQVWRNAANYDKTRSAVATWLMLISRSRALDLLRAQRRRADWTAASATLGAQVEASDDNHIDSTPLDEAGEHAALLSDAIGTLPPEQQEALKLAYFSGLSHSEIAARMAQPLGTVKTRIRLAMNKLRQHLGFIWQEVL